LTQTLKNKHRSLRLGGERNLYCIWQKKCPAFRPGNKVRNRLGVADSSGSQKGESEPTPGYSVFTKKALREITNKGFESSLVLIKDYTEKKSKAGRQTGEKAGQN